MRRSGWFPLPCNGQCPIGDWQSQPPNHPPPLRPYEPDRPVRVPVTRPSLDILTLVRPKPLGLVLPTPEGPPMRDELKMVGRDVGR